MLSPTKPLHALALGVLAVCAASHAAAAQCPAELVSYDSTGSPAAPGVSMHASISNDGRYVAFQSSSPNVVPGDTNSATDVFLRDRTLGTTVLVSATPAGATGSGGSFHPDLSPDGGYVAFASDATDLVAGDTNGVRDIFLRDVAAGTTTRVSVSSTGAEATGASLEPAVSANGRFVTFVSHADDLVMFDLNGLPDVFVHDTLTGTTQLVTPGMPGSANDVSWSPDISADGTLIAFASHASNLVAGDTGGFADVFVRDISTATTTRVSVTSAGVPGDGHSAYVSAEGSAQLEVKISDDGSCVAFPSVASNMPAGSLMVHELATGETVNAGFAADVFGFLPPGQPAGETGWTFFADPEIGVFYANLGIAISPDGRYTAWGTGIFGSGSSESELVMCDRLMERGWVVSADYFSPGQPSYAPDASFPSLADGGLVAYHTLVQQVPGVVGRHIYVRGCADVPISYCTPQDNSQGCTPAIGATAGQVPSLTDANPFEVTATMVLNNKSGLLFYGFEPKNSPFLGGTLCVKAPTKRTPLQQSGGNPPPNDCSGGFSYDFNARIQSGVDPNLAAGADVYAQYWSRDPAAGSTTNLTDALWFVVQP